jgi:hypothetical protein
LAVGLCRNIHYLLEAAVPFPLEFILAFQHIKAGVVCVVWYVARSRPS